VISDRSLLRRVVAESRHAVGLRVLPPRVASFQWRAHRLARRSGDQFSLTSATRARDLAVLLELARRRRRVVELGTGTAWTALALALADPHRDVITYDPFVFPERERYLKLVAPRVLSRVRFVAAPGSAGPPDDDAVDLLYVDSSHEREETIVELRTWQRTLRSGALVILDDYIHPGFPGVREAVEELGLEGELRGTLFVHEVEGSSG
jgi:predicted O-methyltransferase YrrM